MKIAKRLVSLLYIAGALVLLSACDMQQTKSDVVQGIAERYWHTIQQAKYDEALTFYGKEFFSLQPEATWKARLEEIRDKLGPLKSWRLKDTHINTVYSGRQFTFKFINTYEKGHATETLVFFQRVADDPVSIVSHQIESLALK